MRLILNFFSINLSFFLILLALLQCAYGSNEERSQAGSGTSQKQIVYYVPYIPSPPLPPRLHRFAFSGIAGFHMVTSGLQESGNPGFGGSITYTATHAWTLGVVGQLITTTPDDLTQSNQATSSMIALFGLIDYHFPGLEALHLGIRIGAGIRTSTFSTPLSGKMTTQNIGYGVIGGWRFQIIDALALKPQVGLYNFSTAVTTSDLFFNLCLEYWP